MSIDKKASKAFEKYISSKKILIVDPGSSARAGIHKTLCELGAKSTNIVLANNFQTGSDELERIKPEIVLAEYDLGKSCGLELLQKHRIQYPDSKKSLFILVTANSSQTAVARSAEEDIDGYILKPFTPEVLRQTIMSLALMKIKPPEYYQKIDLAKEQMAENKLDEAEKTLNEACVLDPKPSLAYYYLGQIKLLREMTEMAQGSYKTGLSFNKIHYKCLTGLYDTLMRQKSHAEAYDVVKRISQYFPANPKRLGEVLYLAILNEKYEDVEKYYSIFCNIDERSEILIKYICAALVVCGKYYLQTQNRSRAMELFKKAAATSAGRINILKEIVQTLVDAKLAKEAAEYLDRFPPEAHNGEEYLTMKLLVVSLSASPSTVIALGKEILAKNVANEKIYRVMIDKAVESKSMALAENLQYEATSKFPEFKSALTKRAA
jgi:DNA-binding NarL/FixJ family response regulator